MVFCISTDEQRGDVGRSKVIRYVVHDRGDYCQRSHRSVHKEIHYVFTLFSRTPVSCAYFVVIFV